MKFSEYCGPLQVYIIMAIIGITLQIYHTYTKQHWSWVNKNKLVLFLSLIMNIIIFLFMSSIINAICKTNKTLAWMFIFFPLVLVGIMIILLTGGFILDKTYQGVRKLI